MATAEEYEALFKAFDHDGDGVIEQTDVDLLVQRWCRALLVSPGSPQWREITRVSNRLWQHLEGSVDEAGDKQVSRREWVASHEQPGFIENVAIAWGIAVFDMGADADKRVSLQVWMTTHSVTGYAQLESLAGFQRLDEDGDGYIDRDPFVKYIEDFYRREGL